MYPVSAVQDWSVCDPKDGLLDVFLSSLCVSFSKDWISGVGAGGERGIYFHRVVGGELAGFKGGVSSSGTDTKLSFLESVSQINC